MKTEPKEVHPAPEASSRPRPWLDELPPWRAFPRLQPEDLPPRQGAEELWFDSVWRPFWDGLQEEQRSAYLAHWQADGRWREAIAFCANPVSAEALAADFEDSEALRRIHETAHEPPGFWRRLRHLLGGRFDP